ncbi:MAG: hypothetical protein KY469_00280 [Actinobacteria bacterium]|nr:hypothetical protein [Actinomycetota bacterium]
MNTKITKRAIIAAAGMLVLASGAALGADGGEGDATISATVDNIGSRAVTLASATPMTSVLSSGQLTGTLSVTVEELTRTGTNPWSVQAVLDGALSDGLTNTIAASNLAVAPGSVIQTLGGGAPAAGSGGALDAGKTLFSVSGQATDTTYSGTYTQTSGLTLTVPTGTKTGIYTGNVSVTLVQ